MADYSTVVKMILQVASGVVVGGGILVWLGKTIIADWIRNATSHQYARLLEDYKATLRSAAEREFASFTDDLEKARRITEQRWTLRRDTCLEALEVVDAQFTHMDWGAIGVDVTSQPVDITKARSVMNKLVLTCRSSKVEGCIAASPCR